MTSPLFAHDSQLRNPPLSFSKRQILVLDCLRYSAEMAHLAYERLRKTLANIQSADSNAIVTESASALQDAWSIIDSANRFRDFLPHMPGVKQGVWVRQLKEQTVEADYLRNRVQHQLGEINKLVIAGGQIWGYLSWARGQQWHMLSGGTTFVGDRWTFIGPIDLPFSVPNDRIRLNAFDKQAYLGRIVAAIATATRQLELEIQEGKVLGVGVPAGEHRGADAVLSGTIEVLRSNQV